MKGQKIDRKFTDRAWAEMSQLLDREMPDAAPRQKRRIAGWWWLLAGLSLGAGIAALWFSSLQEPESPPPVERPVAQTQNRNEHQLSSPVAENSKATEPVATAAATPQPLKLSAATAATAKAPSRAIPFVAMGENPSPNARNSQSPAVAIPAAKANDTEPETRPSFTISGLASLPLARLPQHQPALRLSLAATAGGKLHPEFLVYASALASPVSAGEGLAAGVLASFPLKNPRLSFESGLGYTYIRQPLSILAPEKDASGTAPTTDESQLVVYGFEDLTAKATRLESSYLLATQDLGLHYAEVPVHLAFAASPKWQFFAGANILVLLESAPSFTHGGLLDATRQMDLANGSPFVNGISSSTLRVLLSKTDAQLLAGARYRLSRNLSLGLQYQMGMVDVVKSNRAADYHRLLRLSLSHHFGW
ncbi:MAG: hypothetical protein EPO28_17915 [Saprospiraceae bacterium]|nr:MAG: hypothetical protein EPO28_17915 [Saprospiraceae bacterium]